MFPILLLLGFFTHGHAQSCPQLEFEIEAVQPTNLVLNSNPVQPNAFTGYFKVYLKVNGGFPANGTIELSQIAFDGIINLSQPSARIDKNTVTGLNASLPYAQYLIVDEKSGEVAWELTNGDENCTSEPPVDPLTITLSSSRMLLFYIAVTGEPGKSINWKSYNGIVKICDVFPPCPTLVPITPPNPVVFPLLNTCDATSFWDFQYMTSSLGQASIDISLRDFQAPPNIPISYVMQATFNIKPEMNGIVDFSFDVATINNLRYFHVGPQLADKSYDVFVELTLVGPPTSLNNIFTLLVNGQYNASLGGKVVCTPLSSRILWRDASMPNWTLCTVTREPKTIIIPGFALCDPGLELLVENQINSNCTYGINYILKPSTGNSSPIDYMKLVLLFEKTTIFPPFSAPLPLLSDLPCPTCWTQEDVLVNNHRYVLVTYEYLAPNKSSAIQVSSPVTAANIGFDFTSGCLEHWIIEAEAHYSGAADHCAIFNDFSYQNPSDWPLCSRRVKGDVVTASFVNLPEPVPAHTVHLTGAQGYALSQQQDCTNPFDFCADITKLPLSLSVKSQNTDYICGVNLLDVLKIQRHILGYLLEFPFGELAADVNNSGSVTGSDIIEIRKLILGAYSAFPLVDSWEFVNDLWVPTRDQNGAIIPPYSNSQSLAINTLPLNISPFRGFKMGDVNRSCACGQKESVQASVSFRATPNRLGVLQINYLSDNPLLAAQTAFHISKKDYEEHTLVCNEELGMKLSDFYYDASSEVLRLLWVSPDGVTSVGHGDWLFRLVPKHADHSTGQHIDLVLESTFEHLAVQEDLSLLRLDFAQASFDVAKGATEPVIEFVPNPFDTQTVLHFEAQSEGAIHVELAHISGLYQRSFDFPYHGGKADYTLFTDLSFPGTYLVRILYNGQVYTSKIQKRVE